MDHARSVACAVLGFPKDTPAVREYAASLDVREAEVVTKQKFPHLVHTVNVVAGTTEPRVREITCTIAGFNSRSYAEEFAKHHSALGGWTGFVIVTYADLSEGVLSAFRDGKPLRLECPCIGACAHACTICGDPASGKRALDGPKCSEHQPIF